MADPIIEVEAPDGSIVEFPGNTDQETILRVMRENFPQVPSRDEQMMQGLGQGMTNSGFYESIPVVGKPLQRWMEARSPEAQGRAPAAMIGVVNGATFGGFDDAMGLAFGPEMGAAVDTMKEASRSAYPVTTTVSEIGGGGAIGGAAAAPFRGMTGARAGLAGGATYGALEAEGGLGERAQGAVKGAAAGWALGRAGDFAFDRIASFLTSRAARRELVANGSLSNTALDLLRRAGLSDDDLTPEFQQSIIQQLQGGRRLDEATRIADAQALPTPVNLTVGQATREPDAMRLEGAARAGNLGGRPARVAAEARNAQQAAIQENAASVRQMVGGSDVPVMPQQGGQAAADRIAREAGEARDLAISTRRTAEQGRAFAPSAILQGVMGRARASMDEVGDVAGTDTRDTVENGVMRSLEAVLQRTEQGELPANVLMRLRSNISSQSASAQGSAKDVLGRMVADLDASIDDAIEAGLITGDEAAVQAYGESTALFRDYYRRYEGKDGARRIIARMNPNSQAGRRNPLEPEEVSAILFGRNGMTPGARGLSLARALKDELGVDSAEWNAIRSEAVTRMLNEAPDGGRIGIKFSSSLENMLTKNGAMMRELFNPDEILAMRRIARVVRSIEANPPAGGNPPQTANMLSFLNRFGGNQAMDFVRGLPVVREVIDSVREGNVARQVERSVNPRR